MTASTVTLLEQWGIWKRYGTGMPKCASATRALMQACTGSTIPEASIEDEEACRVDRAIGRLTIRDPEMGNVVFMYYSSGLSLRTLGKELGMPKDRVERLRLSGVAWIDGVLSVRESA